MRRTKILATLGPASSSAAEIRELLAAGANGFRINCSHGDSAQHRELIRTARAEAARAHRTIFLVADLQGPKLRLGPIAPSPLVLSEGATWTLDDRDEVGGPTRARAEVPDLRHAARPGDPVLLGDGDVELRVVKVGPAGVETRVVSGGPVSERAGIYLPRARLRTSILSDKDREDLRASIGEGVDYVALSFVRSADDLDAARRFAERVPGGASVGWIAKIERAEALPRIDDILDASDAIMVARGDLGIEVPLERLALEQKHLVARARRAGKPAIVATQMLLSMVHAARPTRAEATDAANAILDGADCLMLSEESAVGDHPAGAVGWLDRIAIATERGASYPLVDPDGVRHVEGGSERAVARTALRLAEDLAAHLIVTPTHSGRTARWIAAGRPSTPIAALSSHPETRRRLALVWGVESFEVPDHLDLSGLRTFVERRLDGAGERGRGGPIVLTAGYPVEGRPTNLVTVVERRARSGGIARRPRRRSSARGAAVQRPRG